MIQPVEHIAGVTYHGRKGDVANAFRYSVDYILTDAEASRPAPALFRRNAGWLFALHDSDHGGAPGNGSGAAWVRKVLSNYDLPFEVARIELLAQPRVFGHVFNPVSFWLIRDTVGHLRVVIPEVTNTYGDRHSYLCHNADFDPIQAEDTLEARKIFHVSPFQPVEGGYRFRFDIGDERIAIRIDYSAGNNGGLIATLAGPRCPLTNTGIIRALVRRPFGSRRVLGLIHWQALKLWWKGAVFRSRPEPPKVEVSQ